MTEPETLIADRVHYFAENDEVAFFGWLDRSTIVESYKGFGDGLHIRLSRQPTDDDLRELLAFHHRYDIDMRQLARFETPANAAWFASPAMYWHHGVYGRPNASTRERSAELRMIQIVLHWAWDPIDVRGMAPAIDEYDMYAPAVLELLESGASEAEVAGYLTNIVTERMELPATPEKDADVAAMLKALYAVPRIMSGS